MRRKWDERLCFHCTALGKWRLWLLLLPHSNGSAGIFMSFQTESTKQTKKERETGKSSKRRKEFLSWHWMIERWQVDCLLRERFMCEYCDCHSISIVSETIEKYEAHIHLCFDRRTHTLTLTHTHMQMHTAIYPFQTPTKQKRKK